MNQLTVVAQNGQLLVDSRDVAQMTDKQHKDLLETIRIYNQHLISGNFRPSDFFIESSYLDNSNRNKPCFFLTRKGCDMVANKMTGEKGVLFTATYVTRFEEMEKSIKQKEIQSTESEKLQIKKAEVEAKLRNSKARQGQLLLKMIDGYKSVLSPTAQQSILSHATELVTGQKLIEIPKLQSKLYSATEISNEIGVTRARVGRIANLNGLKDEQFGEWVLDKSPHSNKQVSNFLYNETGKTKILELFQTQN